MVRIEEIREAITRLPAIELKTYLLETIWDGIEEDSLEEEELDSIRDEAMKPFFHGYDNEETRSGYIKLNEVCKLEEEENNMANLEKHEENPNEGH